MPLPAARNGCISLGTRRLRCYTPEQSIFPGVDLPKKSTKRLYLIPILSKALDIMELLQNEKAPMSLEAVYQRTRFSKTTVYRILQTLVHRGYVARAGD